MKIEPVTLENEYVRLEPLSLERHFAGLSEIAMDADLWRVTLHQVSSVEGLRDYLQAALDEQARGAALAFATIERKSNKIVGSTRFGNISVEHKRVEIGWTWIGKNWQRTSVNTAAKFLMLRHAFETWRCNRVELKIDLLNERSQNAVARLGATREGVHRKHLITESGRIRDSVYFSFIIDEWATIKANLESKLKSYENEN